MAGNTPTTEQAQSLQAMFDHINATIFGNSLPGEKVLCTWTRAHQVLFGHLAPERWHSEDGTPLYELAINANVMRGKSLSELVGCMVHEMQHLKELEDGTAGRAGYHKAAFCDALRRIGLPQVDTKTGQDVAAGQGAQSVSQRIADGPSLFQTCVETLPEEAVPPFDSEPEEDSAPQGGEGKGQGEEPRKPAPKSGKRAKYSCPACGLNAWARSGASLLCGGAQCMGMEMIECKTGEEE